MKNVFPEWANKDQIEKWTKKGIVLCDDSAHQVTHLTARAAIQVIDHLQITEEWRQNGIVIGEPVMSLSIDDPEKEGVWILKDQIKLDPGKTQELLGFLERNSHKLRKQAEIEEEDERKLLAKVYSIILGWKE